MKVYEYIALAIDARNNCIRSGVDAPRRVWEDVLFSIARECLPSGSGFDAGTLIVMGEFAHKQFKMQTSYHHMNAVGMYDGWTEHTVTATSSFLGGFDLSISGPNRNDIKSYMYDIFSASLNQPVPEKCKFEAHFKEAA